MREKSEKQTQTQIVKPLKKGGEKSAIRREYTSVDLNTVSGQSQATKIVIKKSKDDRTDAQKPLEKAEAGGEINSADPSPTATEPEKFVTETSDNKPQNAEEHEHSSAMEGFFFDRLEKIKSKGKIGKAIEKIRKTFGKCFAPLNRLLDGIAADFSDRSFARQTLIAILKLKVPICIVLVAVTAFSGCFFLLESSNTATTEMSLNYEESAYGLNPNSTRFNVYNIAGQEVVGKMLEYCGIDPETVDLNEISNCISVNPTNKKSFNEETLFITTTYRITLKNPPEITGISTKQMLTFLCKAYKDYLYSNYTENRSILSFDIDMFNDEEYLEIADLLDLKAQQIEKYLNTRVKQSKSFTEKESDESFKSLSQKVEDLRNYDIAKYRAFVIESGCSHNKARYLRSLEYINRMKQIDYNKDISAYNVHNQGIKMYDEAMISVVMIPSIDESKNTYYMSKTKTGMDYMAQRADDYLKTAQETAKEIEVNSDIMSKMKAGENKSEDIKKADSMIKNIRQKFTTLSSQIEVVDKAYIKHKTKDYLTFKTSNPSLLQKLQATKLAVIVVILAAGIYILIWLRFRYFSGGNKK